MSSKIPSMKTGDYIHQKTGNRYTVLYVAIDKNNDIDIQVVYKDETNLYVREINDFLSKFSIVEPNNE